MSVVIRCSKCNAYYSLKNKKCTGCGNIDCYLFVDKVCDECKAYSIRQMIAERNSDECWNYECIDNKSNCLLDEESDGSVSHGL